MLTATLNHSNERFWPNFERLGLPASGIRADVRARSHAPIDVHMEIKLLADHPHCIPTLAEWYALEWEPYYGEDGPGDARADLESRRNRDEIPIGLVAIENGEICGTAALDLDATTGHTPAVVGLLVAPSQRGRGIAREFIESAESIATKLGYSHLYMSTSILGGLLVRKGWYPIGDVVFVNEEQGKVFALDL